MTIFRTSSDPPRPVSACSTPAGGIETVPIPIESTIITASRTTSPAKVIRILNARTAYRLSFPVSYTGRHRAFEDRSAAVPARSLSASYCFAGLYSVEKPGS